MRARVVKKSVYAHWIVVNVVSGIPRASSASIDMLYLMTACWKLARDLIYRKRLETAVKCVC